VPRDLKASENRKKAAAARSNALARIELGQPTTPRVSAAGATSMAVKAEDPAIRAMIDAALAAKRNSRS
jgi:hypothetical protein